MPFDVSTLSMGYIIAYSIQLSGSAIICAIIYTINSLFFGICWYIRVLLLDLQQTFSRINKLYTSDGRSMGYKTYAAKRPFKRTNNNKIKSLQSNGTEIRSFANPTDPAELAHINHVTKLIKNFVEDHNDILRWISMLLWFNCLLFFLFFCYCGVCIFLLADWATHRFTENIFFSIFDKIRQ